MATARLEAYIARFEKDADELSPNAAAAATAAATVTADESSGAFWEEEADVFGRRVVVADVDPKKDDGWNEYEYASSYGLGVGVHGHTAHSLSSRSRSSSSFSSSGGFRGIDSNDLDVGVSRLDQRSNVSVDALSIASLLEDFRRGLSLPAVKRGVPRVVNPKRMRAKSEGNDENYAANEQALTQYKAKDDLSEGTLAASSLGGFEIIMQTEHWTMKRFVGESHVIFVHRRTGVTEERIPDHDMSAVQASAAKAAIEFVAREEDQSKQELSGLMVVIDGEKQQQNAEEGVPVVQDKTVNSCCAHLRVSNPGVVSDDTSAAATSDALFRCLEHIRSIEDMSVADDAQNFIQRGLVLQSQTRLSSSAIQFGQNHSSVASSSLLSASSSMVIHAGLPKNLW